MKAHFVFFGIFILSILCGCGTNPQPVPVPVPPPVLGSFAVTGAFINVKGEMKSFKISSDSAKAVVSMAVKQLEK